jgi:hypothetical protein
VVENHQHPLFLTCWANKYNAGQVGTPGTLRPLPIFHSGPSLGKKPVFVEAFTEKISR